MSFRAVCQLPASQTEMARWNGAKVLEQVKSHKGGKPLHQGIKDIPSGRLPSSQQTQQVQEKLEHN